MKRVYILAVITLSLCLTEPAAAKEVWSVSILGGSAYNFKTPLTIRQSGEDDIRLKARYRTRTFDNAPYYGLRIGKWNGDQAWEFEHLHHKIFLTNNPPEVQHFQVEHGYNLFTINRAWRRKGLIYRIGAGVVVTRPVTIVRGKSSLPENANFFSDYALTGGTLQLGGEKRFYLNKKLFIVAEGKLTASYARIKIAQGSASVPNVALHGLIGFGYDD